MNNKRIQEVGNGQKKSLIKYCLLGIIGCINLSFLHAYQFSYSALKHEWEKKDSTLGKLIGTDSGYAHITLTECLSLSVGKLKEGIISAVSSEEIIKFFDEQDLIRHLEISKFFGNGTVQTFKGIYGFEFPHHGPLEGKTHTTRHFLD